MLGDSGGATINIFAGPQSRPIETIDLARLTEDFKKNRPTDWSVAEAFLCLLLNAVNVDGVFAREEVEEVRALIMRSRAVKSLNQQQLAEVNAVIQKRMQERPNALEEACKSLPTDMRLPVFAHCVDIVLADGDLVAPEADFLNRITGLLDLRQEDAKKVMETMLIKNRF